jgi:hypothetical protein
MLHGGSFRRIGQIPQSVDQEITRRALQWRIRLIEIIVAYPLSREYRIMTMLRLRLMSKLRLRLRWRSKKDEVKAKVKFGIYLEIQDFYTKNTVLALFSFAIFLIILSKVSNLFHYKTTEGGPYDFTRCQWKEI